jgi:hypothetical protein
MTNADPLASVRGAMICPPDERPALLEDLDPVAAAIRHVDEAVARPRQAMNGRELLRGRAVRGPFGGLRRVVGWLSVGAPVAQVLAGRAVEDHDASIPIAVGDESLVGLGIDPDAGGSAEERRIAAAVGLVIGPDRQHQLAVARELLHPVMHVGADPDMVRVIDEDAVRVARIDRDVLRRVAPALHDVALRVELDHGGRRAAAGGNRRLLHL